MQITRHAYKRAKERLGLNKKAFEHTVQKAIVKGVTHSTVKGRLHKWVTAQVMTHRLKLKTYLYADFMLLIGGDTVVSVYKIPQNLLPIK